MSKSPTNEEIIELGEKIYEIIQKYLSSEDGWTFVEEIHDVKMYKYEIAEPLRFLLINHPWLLSIGAKAPQ